MTEKSAESCYRAIALDQAWRLASLLDRNPYSPARGSFSRAHWAWKFVDCPFPRMQEAVFSLSRLHELPGDDNPFFGSPAVAQWIEWGFEYWTKLQHRSGAFDEAYPFEQCLAATAFTSLYAGLAFRDRREKLPVPLCARIERALVRAGEWLLANDETHGLLSNHLGAAVAALELLARLFSREDFSRRARFFLDRILENQSSEGWFREYDGADIGYGTHGFAYVALYRQMTGCERSLEALRRFARFLTFFIHPDGTIGGEYGSRNTEFYYPAGFEMMADLCPHSAAIALAMRRSLSERRAAGVYAMDAFNLLPMLNSVLLALEAERPNGILKDSAAPLPCESAPFREYFPQSGLWAINEPRFYAIVGLGKGGTVSVFDKAARRQTARHAGLVVRRRGKLYTSQEETASPAVRWNAERTEATLEEVPWKNLKSIVFGPWLFMACRLFTLTLGRAPAVSRWVKRLLVRVLIRKKTRPPIRHRRTVRIAEAGRVAEAGIEVEDSIELPVGVEEVHALAQFTSIHMGSSLYCDARSLAASPEPVVLRGGGRVRLRGRLDLSGAVWEKVEN